MSALVRNSAHSRPPPRLMRSPVRSPWGALGASPRPPRWSPTGSSTCVTRPTEAQSVTVPNSWLSLAPQPAASAAVAAAPASRAAVLLRVLAGPSTAAQSGSSDGLTAHGSENNRAHEHRNGCDSRRRRPPVRRAWHAEALRLVRRPRAGGHGRLLRERRVAAGPAQRDRRGRQR